MGVCWAISLLLDTEFSPPAQGGPARLLGRRSEGVGAVGLRLVWDGFAFLRCAVQRSLELNFYWDYSRKGKDMVTDVLINLSVTFLVLVFFTFRNVICYSSFVIIAQITKSHFKRFSRGYDRSSYY